MKRRGVAQETIKILQQGYYEIEGTRVDIQKAQEASEKQCFLLCPEDGKRLKQEIVPPEKGSMVNYRVVNQSTPQVIAELNREGKKPAVLNFASAKNPGGGFLNGAMAQEEALAASSGLYNTLLLHETYYQTNRGCGTMMYTDYAIYSPDVVFFRDGAFRLLKETALASVLTLPAVNMGQVILKGEDEIKAKAVMRERMRLSLAIFAKQGEFCLVLGAYGCGVFRNNPAEVAQWWKELLEAEGYGKFFKEIIFAVLDRSGGNISEFETRFI